MKPFNRVGRSASSAAATGSCAADEGKDPRCFARIPLLHKTGNADIKGCSAPGFAQRSTPFCFLFPVRRRC